MRFGERVQALREQRGLTQEQAAEAANVSPNTWQELEAGNTNVTYATLVGVARALKMTLSDLFKGV